MAISNLLNQVIIHNAEASFDRYGVEVDSSTGTNYNARVQNVTKTKFLPNGQNVTIDLTVDLEGDPPINRDDRITYQGIKYRVYGKKTAVDGQGNVHHTILDLQQWSK